MLSTLRPILFLSCFLLISIVNEAQQSPEQYLYKDVHSTFGKPPIDFAAIDNWTWISPSRVSISDDGNFWSYLIASPGAGNPQVKVQTTGGKTLFTINSRESGLFSGDSKWYIYSSKDSLFFLPLLTGHPRKIFSVANYQTNQKWKTDKLSWLAYQLKDAARTLVLHDFQSGREERMTGITSYSFDDSNRWLICRKIDGGLLLHSLTNSLSRNVTEIGQYLLGKNGETLFYVVKNEVKQQVMRMNLATAQTAILWESNDPTVTVGSLVVDNSGKQLLFMVRNRKDAVDVSSIWYYGPGMEQAEQRLRDGSADISAGLFIGGNTSFSTNGQYIITSLNERPIPSQKARTGAVQVDIWHYKDTVIQSAQLLYGKSDYRHPWMEPKNYRAVLGINGGRLIQLDSEYKRSGLIIGDWAVVKDQRWMYTAGRLEKDEENDEDGADSVWLVSLKDGKCFFWHKEYPSTSLDVSGNGRYLLWFDRAQGHYFTRDLQTGREVNISAKVPVYLGSQIAVDPETLPENKRTGILGWLEDDKALLIYDSYDIWQLDPSGLKKPVCITNGYGRQHGIVLRLTEGSGNNAINNKQQISSDSNLLLTAFDTNSMENGFYRASVKLSGDPEKLFMGACVMDFTKNLVPNNGNLPSSMPPLKARNAKVWIVRRHSTMEAPNYYVTRDFKNYQALTNKQPQKNYNWLTSDLMHFRQMDGTMSRGILYKPQNFDPSKKYPVIFLYYFQYSQYLHAFWSPELFGNAFTDIPWLVSRGYLVFTPDVYFTKDRPRPVSVWNTVEAAGLHLKTLPYVDGKRMGITGHSRAGGYTNYIITHSTLFAAAFEGAGVSNWVSAQHTLVHTDGHVRSTVGQEPYIFTNKQFMMDNPILNADKITSPLLIFHNKLDAAVPWEQGVELYIAMRRLGKPVWMLQYDGQSHNLSQKNAKKDLTIRVTQFFDHYLKGAPAPVWMTRGMPARLKGVETGLELDTNNPQPKK